MNCGRCGRSMKIEHYGVSYRGIAAADNAILCLECSEVFQHFLAKMPAGDSVLPMILFCPGPVPDGHGGIRVCGSRHVDKGVFAGKPHHTHSCQTCGFTWRPAVGFTVGVEFLPGFKDEA